MALLAFRDVDPFESLLDLQATLDRLRQNASVPSTPALSSASVFPPVNLFYDEDGLVVRAEVPGISPEKIDLRVEPKQLTISGALEPMDRDKGSYHRRERRHGQFARTIALPDELDPDTAAAECRNGLLTVRIKKAEAAKPRQISVNRN